MVYYTPQFEQEFSNPLSIIKSYVAATNDAFKKSGLAEVNLKLHCIEKIAIMDKDSDSSNARLDAFDVAKGTISALLNSADIALLVTRSGVSKLVVINYWAGQFHKHRQSSKLKASLAKVATLYSHGIA